MGGQPCRRSSPRARIHHLLALSAVVQRGCRPDHQRPALGRSAPQPAAQHPGVQAGSVPHPNSRCWPPPWDTASGGPAGSHTPPNRPDAGCACIAVPARGRPACPPARSTRPPPRPGRSPRSDRACGSGAPTAGRCRHRRSPGPRTITRSARRTCRAISLSHLPAQPGTEPIRRRAVQVGQGHPVCPGSVKGVEPGRPPSGAGRRRGPAAAPPQSGCRSADTGPIRPGWSWCQCRGPPLGVKLPAGAPVDVQQAHPYPSPPKR